MVPTSLSPISKGPANDPPPPGGSGKTLPAEVTAAMAVDELSKATHKYAAPAQRNLAARARPYIGTGLDRDIEVPSNADENRPPSIVIRLAIRSTRRPAAGGKAFEIAAFP
jgi:hypothetical protein